MKKKKLITETYKVEPDVGFAALIVGIQKEGYRLVSVDRKDTKAVVTYERLESS